MKKYNSLIIYLLLFIFEIALVIKSDLFINNLSTLSMSCNGYILVLLFGFLMALALYITLKKFEGLKLKYLAPLACVLAVIVPYGEGVISSIHILCCYLSFALLSSVTLYLLYQLALYNLKAKVLLKLDLLTLFMIGGLYLHFMVINNLIEFIYITLNLLIYAYLDLQFS